MILTKYNSNLREIPEDDAKFKNAQRKVAADLVVAEKYVDKEAQIYRLADIDYFRVLSRSADLERYAFEYKKAYEKYEIVAEYWDAVKWPKAALLVELKAALSKAYFSEMDLFDKVITRIDTHLHFEFYRSFFYEYRGQAHYCHHNFIAAKSDFEMSLEIRNSLGQKKQIARSESLLSLLKNSHG